MPALSELIALLGRPVQKALVIPQRKSTLRANVPGAYYTLAPKKHGVNLSPPKPSDVHILIIISILQTRTLR